MAQFAKLLRGYFSSVRKKLNLIFRLKDVPAWRGWGGAHWLARRVMFLGALHFALHAHPALANPMGAQVVAGGVRMESAGNVLNIHQSTDRAIIHWQDFSIGAGEVTNFLQNGGGASVLNRVTGGNASQLLGALNANGQVMLLNPNGVFVGQGAVVNVGSFIASTANVTDEAFLQGQSLSFVGATDGKIVNEGSIHANSGDVLLMAKTVENKGTIRAGEGTAALLAGKDFYLRKDVPGAMKVQVTAGAEGSAAGIGVANSGTIEAMQAQLEAQGNVYALAINQAGLVRATGVSRDASGLVVLSAPNGTIRQTGTMLAVNRDGSGGRLSISGRDIMAEASSILTAAGSGVTALAMGGQIEISAEKDATLDGRLDVSAGDGAKGGKVGGDW